MNFALLGPDHRTAGLIDAIVAGGHHITWCGDCQDGNCLVATPEMQLLAEDQGEQWRDLFDRAVADAVIVGQACDDQQLRSTQLQEMAKADRPLLVVHPALTSVLSYFEIDMARGESQALVQVYNPQCFGQIPDQLAAFCDGQSELGPVEQVIAQRMLDDRSRENVVQRFAGDVQLLAKIAGRFDRIGSHGPEADAASYAALTVQLTGPSGRPVRWSVEPVEGASGLQVALVCTRGRIAAQWDDDGKFCRWTKTIDGEQTELTCDDVAPAALAIERFVGAVEQDRRDESNWTAALEAMELADSIEISLRRRRTIDVHHQQLTEHLAFKGSMAAAGCAVILVLPPLLLLVGWVAGMLGLPVADYWPHALATMLALFAALQLLPKLLYSHHDR